MYHFHIDPSVLSEDNWLKAYVGVEEIIKERKKQQNKIKNGRPNR